MKVLSKMEYTKDRKIDHLKAWEIPEDWERKAFIISSISPDASFDPFKIKSEIEGVKTLKDILEEKVLNKVKLSKKEQIQYENIKEKDEREIKDDLDRLKKNMMAQMNTKEGKERQYCLLIKHAIDYSKVELLEKLYHKTFGMKYNEKLESEFRMELDYLREYGKKIDFIELQMTKYSHLMPPLDRKGFSLDDWQKRVINLIEEKKNVLVMCPTSSGKTILSTYVCTNSKKVLFVVPTHPLALQVGSYFINLLKQVIPIETDFFKSYPNKDDNLNLIKNAPVIVGTPNAIENILPYIDTTFDYIVYDEIHSIDEITSLERIIKYYQKVPFLALSATIGNIEDLSNWWEEMSESKIERVEYYGRFFNLQKMVYMNNNLVRINPITLLNKEEILNKKILEKNLEMTPQDVWDLYKVISKEFKLDKKDIYKYMDKSRKIDLQDVNLYKKELLLFLTQQKNQSKIDKVLKSLNPIDIKEDKIDLLDLSFKLRDNDYLPGIIFQLDHCLCYQKAIELVLSLEKLENEKYPDKEKELLKQLKLHKKEQEKKEKKEKEMSEKQLVKELEKNDTEMEIPVLNEPKVEFCINKAILLSEEEINDIARQLKNHFRNYGDEYHPVIRGLWRGIGIYHRNMPQKYLLIVQKLAQNKKLNLVFSDQSLAYGVSMPFKSSIIYHIDGQEDLMNPIINLQASGRAGRRGLDTEGFNIYVGYKINEIRNLLTSPLPRLEGLDTSYPLMYYQNHFHRLNNKNINNLFEKNLSKKLLKYNLEESRIISSLWNWTHNYDSDYIEMIFKLRNYQYDGIIASYLLPFMANKFTNRKYQEVSLQLDIASLLCYFYQNGNLIEKENEYHYHQRYLLNLNIPIKENHFNNELYQIIVKNKIDDQDNYIELERIRNMVFRFGENIRQMQNYCYVANNLFHRHLGKLFTRIWWIYYDSASFK